VRFPDRLPLLDWVGLLCLVLVAAVLLPGATLRSPRWSYALALLAPVVLAERLLSLADVLGFDPGPASRPGWPPACWRRPPSWAAACSPRPAPPAPCAPSRSTRPGRRLVHFGR